MSTTITLIRHGKVHNPERILYARLPRFTLSEEGFEQARAAATVLKDASLVAVFSSPMLRARKTALEILKHHPDLKMRISRHLVEVFTPYEGRPLDELEAVGWDFYTDIQSPYETPGDILIRVHKFFRMARRDYAGQHIAAVTHGDIVGFATLWARGLPVSGEGKRDYFVETPGVEYPATASLTTFTFETDSADEIPEIHYQKPY
jgi:broad specificity phosphatase PhoE